MSGQLKEVRDRIKSVKSTQQITRAMKMVSAAKLRRAQESIQKLRPYANRLDYMLKNILSNLEGEANSAFGTKRDIQSALVVVITSNRGLCGAFNSNIIKKAVAKIDEDYAHLRKEGKLSLLFIGKRGFDYFRKRYPNCNLITDYVDLFNDLSFDSVSHASTHIMDMFSNGEVDAVHVAYGRFKNAGIQFPELKQYVPVRKIEKEETKGVTLRSDYIFEPDKKTLLDSLIPSILQTTFQKFLLDTHASEHGARMTAMDSATENAEDILKGLKIHYNKARQESITSELSEIVGGAAALEG